MGSNSAFIKVATGRFLEQQSENVRKGAGQPAERPTFRKPIGYAEGRLEVLRDLPHDLAVGIFAGGPYKAWVRFSSDNTPDGDDQENCPLGLGIKLFGVPGRKMLEGYTEAQTQDFVFQNSDIFPAANAREFMEITEAKVQGRIKEYLGTHPVAAKLVGAMFRPEQSALTAVYNSVTPSRFGRSGSRYVKYIVQPHGKVAKASSASAPKDPNYLAKDFEKRLKAKSVTLEFSVQFQTNPSAMPLDDATIPWDQTASPPVPVARLVLNKLEKDHVLDLEDVSFNPWHTLPEHQPVGSLSDARRVAYVLAADARRRMNQAPLAEPQA